MDGRSKALSERMRCLLVQDKRLANLDVDAHMTEVCEMPGLELSVFTMGVRGAAEGILCGLSPMADDNDLVGALLRLAEVNPRMAAGAAYCITKAEGGGMMPALYAVRFHERRAAHAMV